MRGLDRLAERVFDYLRDQMPKNTTEALQDQVEQLMKEKEKLKAATGRICLGQIVGRNGCSGDSVLFHVGRELRGRK